MHCCNLESWGPHFLTVYTHTHSHSHAVLQRFLVSYANFLLISVLSEQEVSYVLLWKTFFRSQIENKRYSREIRKVRYLSIGLYKSTCLHAKNPCGWISVTKRKWLRVYTHTKGAMRLVVGWGHCCRWAGPWVHVFHHAIMLIQPSPCGVSVGVSEAAARPWGNVHFIQLLFHVTELLSAAIVPESP